MRFLTSWWSGRRRWARAAFVLGFLGVATAAVGWGRNNSLLHVTAASPPDQGHPVESRDQAQVAALQPSGNYSDRAVGYIYGSTPITREQLADYLIARYGAARL